MLTAFSICSFSVQLIDCIHSQKRNIISSCDLELRPMTFSFGPDLDSAEMNRLAKCLHQRSLSSEVIIRTHTARPTALPESLI